MDTQNTFIRYSETVNGEPVKPVYQSIADLLYVGVLFDADSGEDLAADLELYRMASPNNYQQIA